MNVTTFKTRLADFMSRHPNDLISNSVDQGLAAINDARLRAQRRYTFKRLRGEAFIKTSILGAPFTDFKLTPEDGGTAQKVKMVEEIFTFTARTIPAGTVYERTGRVDYRTSRELTSNVPPAGVNQTRWDARTTVDVTGCLIGFLRGERVFVNTDTATWFLCDIVKQLSPLVGDESSDFFIDNAEDWLLFESAQVLNGYLKEDQRVAISQRALELAWETFTQWDADVEAENHAIDLA